MTREPIDMRRFRRDDGAGPALPDDPKLLARYHGLAGDLLAMLAHRVEPSWDLAEAALAEIERLISLQTAIVGQLAAQPAGSPEEVMLKLRLWSLARGAADPRDVPPEDRLVHSAIADLERLFGAG